MIAYSIIGVFRGGGARGGCPVLASFSVESSKGTRCAAAFEVRNHARILGINVKENRRAKIQRLGISIVRETESPRDCHPGPLPSAAVIMKERV